MTGDRMTTEHTTRERMTGDRSRTVAWYVHHHGRGHLTRLLAIVPHLDAQVVCFSSLPRPDGLPEHCSWVVLDRDDDVPTGAGVPAEADPTAGGLLHWAPLGHLGHRRRLATIAQHLADDRADVLVVDVSVEVMLLGRLLGVPTVMIAQPGLRDDAPHRLGLDAATRIIAPWPEELLVPAHLDAVRDRVVYTGGISRFDGRTRLDGAPEPGTVLLLGGAGGSAVSAEQIEAAAERSARSWTVVGATGSTWSADPWEQLVRAEVVVSWAGQNAIADLAASGAAAVVIPQERPFDEQLETALALERSSLAVLQRGWPVAEDWDALLDRAAAGRPDWSRWHVAGAAQRAAGVIESVMDGTG